MQPEAFDQTAYAHLLDRAAAQGLPPRPERRVKILLRLLAVLYESGAQFFAPVGLNSKKLVWNDPREKPVRWKTIRRLLYVRAPRQHGKRGRRLYDLAVRTGKWKLPDRDKNWILAVFDADDWYRTPPYIKAILVQYPTFVEQTRRGFHFYFYVPKWFSKSGSNPGIADWLARGRIAVVTGADRQILLAHPIATLAPKDARTLYEFATQAHTPDIGYTPRPTEDFAPIEGERNARLNAELYRLRHLPDDQLMTTALELAEKCLPPYPPKEAAAIAKSILRHKHRFPVSARPEKISHSPYNGDHRYTRLGKYFPAKGSTFTRRDYEQKLLEDGWSRNQNGKIEAARLDIAHNLQKGELRIAGKRPSGPKGGRPELIYERTRDYAGETRFLLPGRVTHQKLRLSALLHRLQDEPVAIARETLRRDLRLKDVGTISRYARLLEDETRWGAALIRRTVRPPVLMDDRLDKRFASVWPVPHDLFRWLYANFVWYRPSLYQRTPAYAQLFPTPAQQIQERLQALLTQWTGKSNRLQATPTGHQQNSNFFIEPPQPAKADKPCINVAKITKTSYQPSHQQRPELKHPPPEAISAPFGAAFTLSDEELSPSPPPQEAAPIPEVELIGYPRNYYLGGGQTLFEYIEECYLYRSRWEFHQRVTPEQQTAWQDYYFRDVTCPVCHQVRRFHHTEIVPERCDACWLKEAKRHPLPDAATTLLRQYAENPLARILTLCEATFGQRPRTQKEVRQAIDQYGWRWVETAVRVIGKKTDVRYPWPAVVGTLKNWHQQGRIPPRDQRIAFQARVRSLLTALGQPHEELAVAWGSVYEAYDRHVDYLTEETAYLLTDAVRRYGERAVRYAIWEAARYQVNTWTYCRQVLERLRRQGKLREV